MKLSRTVDNLRFSGGVLCGKYFLSIQTDQSVH